jgi:hypothetical protein
LHVPRIARMQSDGRSGGKKAHSERSSDTTRRSSSGGRLSHLCVCVALMLW